MSFKKNYMKQLTHFLCIGLAVLSLAACEKEDNKNEKVENTDALLLNEGDFTKNNATLSALNITTGDIDNHWFEDANGYGLGKQAQDMIYYNTKVYVTVTESNTLEAIDPTSGRSTQKSLGTLHPRSIAADGGKLYITCYTPACVVRVDAASLAVEDTCLIGDYVPEGIAISHGKAFVAGAYKYTDYYDLDTKVHVIDLTTFDTLPSITVGINNQKIVNINDDKLMVCWGNGYDVPAGQSEPNGSAIIDASTHAVTPVNHGLSKMDVYNGKVYGYNALTDGPLTWVVINSDGTTEDFPFTPTISHNAYGINIDPTSGDIYLMDADYQANGDVLCYTPDGTLRFKSETAKFPSKVIFL